jgi:hypothetical protein
MVALSALPMNIAQQLKETSTFLPGRFQRALQNSSALERFALSLCGLRIKQNNSCTSGNPRFPEVAVSVQQSAVSLIDCI